MTQNYLSQALSTFVGVPSEIFYVYPTNQNLRAGVYESEILDIKEVLKETGELEALDFYHRLTYQDGTVKYVRFRHYAKELPALATSLKQYSQVKTWADGVGLREEVTVAPKMTGNYMRIATRKVAVSSVSSASTNSGALPNSSTQPSTQSNRGGIISKRTNTPLKSSLASKRANLLQGDEDDEDDDDYCDGVSEWL